MGNPFRGDVSLTVDGVVMPMRLTLGAIAELEEAISASSLVTLIERFEEGTFKAVDLLSLLTAGLRGAGWDGSSIDLGQSEIEGGVLEASRAAGLLLKRAFNPVAE